jgi:hypothetical protein
MSTLNVDQILPQSGTKVDVNGIVIKDTVNAAFVLYGGTAFNANTSVGTNTTVIGNGAMLANTGTSNTAVGALSLRNNTSGTQNTALSVQALNSNTTGNGNTAIGKSALQNNTTGNSNTAIGADALLGVTTGIENVGVGGGSGFNLTTGSFNVIVGVSSGALITTGSNNVCLGDDTQTATPTTSNSITLGNGSHNILRCNVTSITSLSDARDKTNIEESTYGLDLVKSLKPVTFEWDTRDGVKKGVKDLGFIAQDLKELDDEHLGLVYSENPEKLEASYGRLIPVLVKAIQDLSKELETLKNK